MIWAHRFGRWDLAIETNRAALRGLGFTFTECSCGVPVVYLIHPWGCIRIGLHREVE